MKIWFKHFTTEPVVKFGQVKANGEMGIFLCNGQQITFLDEGSGLFEVSAKSLHRLGSFNEDGRIWREKSWLQVSTLRPLLAYFSDFFTGLQQIFILMNWVNLVAPR